MGRYREKTSTFFAGLTFGLRRKPLPAVVPLSKSLEPPAPQTSLIFQLPDELILSILSHVSQDPRFANHYARFRALYCMETNDYYRKRMRLLRQLSMTCRAMWLRLMPWMWERLECLQLAPSWSSEGRSPKKLNAIVNVLRADVSLGTCVKFLTVYIIWDNPTLPKFVKCLESLPNLHTLEIGWSLRCIATPLENALKGVDLPQIKALVLPPAAYPLLRHCRNVEDVVCAVKYGVNMSSDEVLGTLTSNQDSKVKRLAIPLVSWGNSSRYVAACSGLTELTLIYPYPDGTLVSETGVPLDVVETTHSAAIELVNACKSHPDLDTIQIVHFVGRDLYPSAARGYRLEDGSPTSMERRRQELRTRVKGVKDLVVDCLKKPKTGCQEGEGRKKTTLRVIELDTYRLTGELFLDSMRVEKVEGYEVWGFDSKGP